MMNALDFFTEQQNKRDEFTIFGEWIASELRPLRADQAAFAKRKLGRAFNEILDEAALIVVSAWFSLFAFALLAITLHYHCVCRSDT